MLHLWHWRDLKQAISHGQFSNFQFFPPEKLLILENTKPPKMISFFKQCIWPEDVRALVLFVCTDVRDECFKPFLHNISVFFCSSSYLWYWYSHSIRWFQVAVNLYGENVLGPRNMIRTLTQCKWFEYKKTENIIICFLVLANEMHFTFSRKECYTWKNANISSISSCDWSIKPLICLNHHSIVISII